MFLTVLYYLIITVFALFLLVDLLRKKEESLPKLISIAVVLIVFALRALHIK